MSKTAQVHRFGDCVALYVGSGQTVYVTPLDAKRLGDALKQCANDIVQRKFVDSEFRTTVIEFADTGHNGCSYDYQRKEPK